MSVRFRDVTKTLLRPRRRTLVLEDATFDLPGDEPVGILALPGTGKTTLTHLITGSYRPDYGRVARTTKISFPVGALGAYSMALSGRENLSFVCRVYGFDPRPVIHFVLDVAGLKRAMDRPMRQWDRDEKTRFLFAASYAMPFETYAVDGALIGGRGAFRDLCQELVEERMADTGFLIATSSPLVMRRYCSRFFVLHERTVSEVGSVDEARSILGLKENLDDDGSVLEIAEAEEE